MAFPRDDYEAFLTPLFDGNATIYWDGAAEPFFNPVGNSMTTVKIDVGSSYGYGTSEERAVWSPTAQGGDGAWQYFVLQRMVWPLTIDVETLDADTPGEDVLMEVRGKYRWRTNIARIQALGLTTVRVGNVLSMPRMAGNHESFGAKLEISHGQCYVSEVLDSNGNCIESIETVNGTITKGMPASIALNMANVPVGGS